MRALAVLALACMLAASVYAAEWELVSPTLMTIAIGVSLNGDRIYVSGGQNGIGAMILRSENEGENWRSIPTNIDMNFMDVSVEDGNSTGVAGGLGMFQFARGLSFTEDGEEFFAAPGSVFASAYQKVEAKNGTAYAVGFEMESLVSSEFYGVVLTRDNGQTVEYFPWGIDEAIRYGSFPSDDIWYITGGSWPALNAGQSFGPITKHGYGLNSRISLSMKNQQIKVMDAAERKSTKGRNGYTGVIAKTVDGGKTFQVVYQENDGFYFNGISCPTVDVCYATAEGPEFAYIFASKDGGATWEKQYETAVEAGLFDVEFVNELEGWAVGGYFTRSFVSLLLSTTDGGATWTEYPVPFDNYYPNAISCDAFDHCAVTAFNRFGDSGVLVLH